MNILHEISKRNASWIGHIFRRNYLLQVIEAKVNGLIQLTGRRGKSLRKLLNDLKERREYPHLWEKALNRATWGGSFGSGFGPFVGQNNK
jgi:hypothetical protein